MLTMLINCNVVSFQISQGKTAFYFLFFIKDISAHTGKYLSKLMSTVIHKIADSI